MLSTLSPPVGRGMTESWAAIPTGISCTNKLPVTIFLRPCAVALSGVLLIVSLPALLVAQESRAVSIDRVQVGLAGQYKLGRWTPIAVDVTTSEPFNAQLSVEVTDSDGHPVTVPFTEVQLAAAGEHRLHGVFKSGRAGSPVIIRIGSGDAILAERALRPSAATDSELQPGLRQSVLFVAALGPVPGFEQLAAAGEFTLPGSETKVPFLLKLLESPSSLPLDALGLDALDVLIISEGYDLTAEADRVIRDWVHAGGHLIVTTGEHVENYRNSPLAKWIPVTVSGQSQLRNLSGLESLSGRNEAINLMGRSIPAAQLEPGPFAILAVAGVNDPLVVRAAYGFGKVTFVGIDLHQPPISSWGPLVDVARRLMSTERRRQISTQRTERGQLSHSGVSDLATQLRAAEDHFPKVKRSTSWTVMGLLALYLVLVGPLDYLVVNRLLGRPAWTWVTFPLLVVIAVGASSWAARTSNGNQQRTNQIQLLDFDEASGTGRGRAWMSVYSPEARRYEAKFEPRTIATQNEDSAAGLRLSWDGAPEDGFGGLYRSGGVAIGRAPYHLATDSSAVPDLPVAIWSSKCLAARWQLNDQDSVDSKLESTSAGSLRGTFSHHLPGPLTDWFVAYRDRVYRPKAKGDAERPALAPKKEFTLSAITTDQRSLSGLLTGETTVERNNEKGRGKEYFVEQVQYDPLGREPLELLRILSFHDVVGGKRYTGLDNHALRDLDLSELLQLNRAVLFGVLEQPAGQLQLNGQPTEPELQRTVVRIVMPVVPAQADQEN